MSLHKIPCKYFILLFLQDLVSFVHQQAAKNDRQAVEEQSELIYKQSRLIRQLQEENRVRLS